MNGKPTMKDLKEAILTVLGSAVPVKVNDRIERAIPLLHLQILQAEYNIHFVEPEEKQVEIV